MTGGQSRMEGLDPEVGDREWRSGGAEVRWLSRKLDDKDLVGTWEATIRRHFCPRWQWVCPKSCIPGSQRDMVCHQHRDGHLLRCNADSVSHLSSGWGLQGFWPLRGAWSLVLRSSNMLSEFFLERCFSFWDIRNDSNYRSELRFISLATKRIPCLHSM